MLEYWTKHIKKLIFTCLIGLIANLVSIQSLFQWLLPEYMFEKRRLVVRIALIIILTVIYGFAIYLAGNLTVKLLQWAGVVKVINKWIPTIASKINTCRPIQWMGWVIIGIVAILLLFIHIRLIVYPYQMEYREGAIVLTTQAFLHGINPWALENNPIYINVYGFVYNFMILPFTLIFGNKVWIYRLLSFLAIQGQIALVMKVMRKKGIEWLWVVIAGLFIWLGQIYYTTPLARPDAVGQFFFLLTLFLPWLSNFSPRSLVFSAIFGLLGFYTKPYYILGILLISAYVFLFYSKKNALLYAMGSLIVFILSALLINRVFEAYFLNVIFSHVADTNSIFSYMVKQTIKFGRDYWALLIFCAVAILVYFLGRNDEWKIPRLSLFPLQNPFITIKMDFCLFIILISAGLIYFSLGRHNGTIQAYYYQLLTPFLVVLVFGYLQNNSILRGSAIVLISINLLTHAYENLKPDFVSYDVEPWVKMSTYLNNSPSTLNNPSTVLLLIEKGITIQNSGQTEYYFPYPAQNTFYYPDLTEIEQIGNQYLTQREILLLSQQFNLYMSDDSYKYFYRNTDAAQKYKKIDTITISMPHVLQEWTMDIMVPSETVINDTNSN